MNKHHEVAIVTGGGRPWGVGRATALALARAGMRIVIADIREDWGAEAASVVTKETGQPARYIQTDVSQRASVAAMVDGALAVYGRIDVLANVAAVVGWQRAEEMTDEHFDRLFNTNVRGIMLTCQAVIPVMRRQGGGRIVNVSSLSSLRPLEGLSMYGATKAAVSMYSKDLALEALHDKIIVVTVAPSSLATAMGMERGPTQEEIDRQGKATPIGRALLPDDLAEVIVFAATSKTPALAGQVLHANGGAYLVS